MPPVRSALSVGAVTGLARCQSQPLPGQPECPPALPGDPSQWCQVDLAGSTDVDVPDLPGSRGRLAGPCPTCVWRAGLQSHPAEFPRGWNGVGRQHGTCGRGWMAPRACAWDSGPSWSESGLARRACPGGLCSFCLEEPLGRGVSPVRLGWEPTAMVSWDIWGADMSEGLSVWGCSTQEAGGRGLCTEAPRCVCTCVCAQVAAGRPYSPCSSELRARCKQQLMSGFVARCVEVPREL